MGTIYQRIFIASIPNFPVPASQPWTLEHSRAFSFAVIITNKIILPRVLRLRFPQNLDRISNVLRPALPKSSQQRVYDPDFLHWICILRQPALCHPFIQTCAHRKRNPDQERQDTEIGSRGNKAKQFRSLLRTHRDKNAELRWHNKQENTVENSEASN